MNNKPVIDLSLRHPQLIIKDKGIAHGLLLVLWFRLLRPACVGSMWAGITIYAYRYLLPFSQGDLSIPELLSYIAAISAIASALTTWLILARVAHPFASKSRTQRLLRRKAGLTVEPGPIVGPTRRDWRTVPRVFVASHDANGLIAALRAQSDAQPAEKTAESRKTARLGYGQTPPTQYSLQQLMDRKLHHVPVSGLRGRRRH
ncbi:Biofilm PGA synthesis auxiliary protein PgaD [Paraburkholderia denitrificans]|uniref:Biofilm PGA synthesis auxiliary protein PgaD n=1 Tax=Paraburkholderia denitrificans TaxID=694025 RepID=A0ABW0JBZ7_9BURK